VYHDIAASLSPVTPVTECRGRGRGSPRNYDDTDINAASGAGVAEFLTALIGIAAFVHQPK
jgi:hypothetical protein